MNIVATVSLVGLTIGGSLQPALTAVEGTVCPTEAPRSRHNLSRFLTGPEFADARVKTGLSHTTTADARILSDALDAGICARLNEAFTAGVYGAAPYRRTYYEANGFYFVTITQERTPGKPFRMGHAPPVVVFSRDLQPLNLSPAQP